ncbi:hypothetical protein OH492_01685 [Vibrio chagasii]|nr:hypothetical protein [Vibrio chagasii]
MISPRKTRKSKKLRSDDKRVAILFTIPSRMPYWQVVLPKAASTWHQSFSPR